MKKIFFSLAVSCLILQTNSISFANSDVVIENNESVITVKEIDAFNGINTTDESKTIEKEEPQETKTELTDPDLTNQTNLTSNTPNPNSFGKSARDARDNWASNTKLAKGISPQDLLKSSTKENLSKLLKLLTGLVSEEKAKGPNRRTEQGKKVTRLNKNKKNLDHTKDNLKNKVLWDLTIQEMMDARVKGIGDNQDDVRDVKLVKDFLESLKPLQDKDIPKVIWNKINDFVSIAMPADNPVNSSTRRTSNNQKTPWISATLAKKIIDSFTGMMSSKNISDFKWDLVEKKPFIKTSDEAKYSYYKESFLYGATVQVYLQLIKEEITSIRDILTFSELINDKKSLDTLIDIEIPSANKSLFTQTSGFSLEDIVKAYKSDDKKAVAQVIFKHLEKDLGDSKKVSTEITKLNDALTNLSKDEIILSRVDAQMSFVTAQKAINENLNTVTDALNEKVNASGEVGKSVKLSDDSIFERKGPKIILKASFLKAVKDAKNSKDIAKLQSQLVTAQENIVNSANEAQNVHDEKLAKDKKEAERKAITDRNTINLDASERHNTTILNNNKDVNKEDIIQKLETPINGKITGIRTSLRVRNAYIQQIGSMLNNDPISIIGIRWDKAGELPLSYIIDMTLLQKRLKSKYKEQTEGYIAAKYVSLEDPSKLAELRILQDKGIQTRADNKTAAETLAARKSNLAKILPLLKEITDKPETFLDNVPDNMFNPYDYFKPNKDFINTLKELHLYFKKEESLAYDNEKRRNETIELILNFFEKRNIYNEARVISALSPSKVQTLVTNRMKVIWDWSKSYLEKLDK